MAVEVILPKVDMDMTTGIISKWHVKNGDSVSKGAVLFEMETDKSAIEIESSHAGSINNLAEPGKAIAIGAVVAMIYAAGESVQTLEAAAPAAAVIEVKATQEGIKAITPVANGTGMRATPLARRLARQKNISLESLSGSGPRGRITAADVEIHKTIGEPCNQHLIPLDAMRRTIAQRLTLSKQTIPHFYLTSSCDISQLLEIRERLNNHSPLDANNKPLWKLSINDYVIKALALALQRVPSANVCYTDAGLLHHTTSDIGVAVSVEGGLFTPVLRNADAKSLSQISIEMKDLASRARAKKLQPAEYQGGSSSISNLGMYGIEDFTAIINPPQATILAVGAGVEQFVPINKLPVIKTLMKCTLSCDHRAIDGAVGAQLLQTFRALIEEPALMLA
jgi:pyruvate dehydrogenase E2 component (dihydrolipoamide acetyltransferase)